MTKVPGAAAEEDSRQGDLFAGASARPREAPRAPVAPKAEAPVVAKPVAKPPAPVSAPPAKPAAAPAAVRAQRPILTVGELTRRIKGAIEGEFRWVCVRGEVSGFRGPNPRGHLYFSLKDRDACLDVKLWASNASRLKFKLRDGLEVIVEGSVDVYEPQGRYSLTIQRIEPAGEGALALAFQQLKERLMAEGLFGDRRKRPIRPLPFLPRRIGVVTSRSGAALRDFLRVLHQRHPRLPVLIADARVQGEGAAFEVIRALHRLARTDVDVIVLARGGGSIEDLWTFNEEPVARAIHACPVPVVSAIGHEVDFTIADFVADFRAPTPSAAAERLAPVLADVELGLRTTEGRLRKAAERHVLAGRERLVRLSRRLADPRRVLGQKRLLLSEDTERMVRALRQALRARREAHRRLWERLGRKSPQAQLRQQRRDLTEARERLRRAQALAAKSRAEHHRKLSERLSRAAPQRRIQQERRRLQALRAGLDLAREQASRERRRFGELVTKLEAMSPLKVMARGYAVAFRSDGHVLRSVDQLRPGDALSLRLNPAPGARSVDDCDRVDATVTSTRPGKS